MDITMCTGKNCPLSTKCYRFTAKPSEFRQSYFVEPPYDEEKKSCEYFWADEVLKRSAEKIKKQ